MFVFGSKLCNLCRDIGESCWECTVVAFVSEATMFGFGKNTVLVSKLMKTAHSHSLPLLKKRATCNNDLRAPNRKSFSWGQKPGGPHAPKLVEIATQNQAHAYRSWLEYSWQYCDNGRKLGLPITKAYPETIDLPQAPQVCSPLTLPLHHAKCWAMLG